MTGRTISHYRIAEKLGDGGMGVVYRAEDVRLQRVVALKFLPTDMANDPDARERFTREARAASALDHPNIGSVYEIDETDDGRLFIAMACYEGETLREKIDRGPLPIDEAVDYTRQMAAGLAKAHEAGIVHRDVKPANAIATGDGLVKIVDFGLAKMTGRSPLTKTRTTMGTFAYMSPEQIQGGAVDQRSDIWSLGVVLYEMITGELPFQADYEAAVLYTILNQDPEPIATLRSEAPELLQSVAAKALAKQPEERYSHMGEMLADLDGRAGEADTTTLWHSAILERPLPVSVHTSDSTSAPATVNITYNLPAAEARDRNNLLILLRKVRQFWVEGVLEQSIHGEALIDLGKEMRPEAVAHPWEQILELPGEADRRLPADQPIGELFDEVGRSLLILGAPGSGKTVTLLELARALLARAEADPLQPVPVAFNLSSWTDPQQGLLDWLAAELSVKYQVPKKQGRLWLDENRLALLLDGLDEVRSEHRAACVEAINSFVEEYGAPGLAVCSRLEDYTVLPVRLKLYAAVSLQPLNTEQVREYVSRSGEALAGLQTALEQDRVLQALAESPLMLDVMSLAYRDAPAEALQSEGLETAEARRGHLFETYIDRMFGRKGKGEQPFGKEETLGWLEWLARGMQKHGQSVFQMDHFLQPGWLPARKQRWIYVFSTRLIEALVFGMIMALAMTLTGGPDELMSAGAHVMLDGELMLRLVDDLLFGLFFGFIVGSIDVSRFEEIRIWKWVRKANRKWQIGINVILIGLIAEFIDRLIAGWLGSDNLEPLIALFIGSSGRDGIELGGFAFICGIFWGIPGSRQHLTGDIQIEDTWIWSWFRARQGGLTGLSVGLVFGAIIGLCAMSNEVSPEKWVRWLGITMAGGLVGLFAGLIRGLKWNKLIEMKAAPNQGIKLSIRNAVWGGMLSGIGFGLFFALFGGMFTSMVDSPAEGLQTGVQTGLSAMVLVWLLVGFWYGGMPVIRHYLLRFLLYGYGHMPLHYERFLDYAARLIFLKKVGGGYIFIHRLLLEHFASRREAQASPS